MDPITLEDDDFLDPVITVNELSLHDELARAMANSGIANGPEVTETATHPISQAVDDATVNGNASSNTPVTASNNDQLTQDTAQKQEADSGQPTTKGPKDSVMQSESRAGLEHLGAEISAAPIKSLSTCLDAVSQTLANRQLHQSLASSIQFSYVFAGAVSFSLSPGSGIPFQGLLHDSPAESPATAPSLDQNGLKEGSAEPEESPPYSPKSGTKVPDITVQAPTPDIEDGYKDFVTAESPNHCEALEARALSQINALEEASSALINTSEKPIDAQESFQAAEEECTKQNHISSLASVGEQALAESSPTTEARENANEPSDELQDKLFCETGNFNEDVTGGAENPISPQALLTDCDDNGSAIDPAEYQEVPLDSQSETDDTARNAQATLWQPGTAGARGGRCPIASGASDDGVSATPGISLPQLLNLLEDMQQPANLLCMILPQQLTKLVNGTNQGGVLIFDVKSGSSDQTPRSKAYDANRSDTFHDTSTNTFAQEQSKLDSQDIGRCYRAVGKVFIRNDATSRAATDVANATAGQTDPKTSLDPSSKADDTQAAVVDAPFNYGSIERSNDEIAPTSADVMTTEDERAISDMDVANNGTTAHAFHTAAAEEEQSTSNRAVADIAKHEAASPQLENETLAGGESNDTRDLAAGYCPNEYQVRVDSDKTPEEFISNAYQSEDAARSNEVPVEEGDPLLKLQTLPDRVDERTEATVSTQKAASIAEAASEQSNRNREDSNVEAKLLKIFNMFDNHGQGSIAVSDVGNVLRCLDMNPTEAEIDDFIGQLSPNDDHVSWEQFSSVACNALIDGWFEPVPEEDLVAAFAVFDEDSSGLMSMEELTFIMTSFGEPLSDEELEAFIAFVQKNEEEGFVDYSRSAKELCTVCQNV